MPQYKVLVDSNVYFRLAREIHPLLQVEFGTEKWCLYVIDGFEGEYLRSSRLKSEFSWVSEQKYKANRTRPVSLSRRDKKLVAEKIPFLEDAAADLKLTTGPVDIQALSVALVLNIPVATDDYDMRVLAEEFEVKTIKALEVLKFLETCGRVDRTKVRAIVGYWNYLKDCPKNFREDYIQIFSEEPPEQD